MKFTIQISPKAQKRARSRAVKSGDRTFTMTYTDKDQRTEQNRLMALMYEHRPPEPLQGAIALGVRAYLPIPKSKPKKWQAAAMAGEIRPTTKPDIDNLAKNIEDVMNGVFFVDDRQIVTLSVEKWYGEPARWEISLESIEL